MTDVNDKLPVTLATGEWLWLLGVLASQTASENVTLDKLYSQVMGKIS